MNLIHNIQPKSRRRFDRQRARGGLDRVVEGHFYSRGSAWGLPHLPSTPPVPLPPPRPSPSSRPRDSAHRPRRRPHHCSAGSSLSRGADRFGGRPAHPGVFWAEHTSASSQSCGPTNNRNFTVADVIKPFKLQEHYFEFYEAIISKRKIQFCFSENKLFNYVIICEWK